MIQSWRDLTETLLLALGLLALLYTAMLSAGVINQKDVRLSPSFERKRTMIANKIAPMPAFTPALKKGLKS